MTVSQKDKKMRALAAYSQLVQANEFVDLLLDKQLRSFGLTTGQFRALEALLGTNPMSQAMLGEKIARRESTVQMVIQSLQKRGLVVRRAHETDRRKMMVHLTPAGRKLIVKLVPPHEKLIRAQMSALNDRDQETLRRLCEKLGIGSPIKFALELTAVDEDESDEG